MQDYRDPTYLKYGNNTQQKCWQVLVQTRVLELLSDYDPIVVGTIPIAIDIPGSDIDIVCNTSELKCFLELCQTYFGHYEHFFNYLSRNFCVTTFKWLNLQVEIYADSTRSVLQNGYRHMCIEDRILRLGNALLRDRLINYKQAGIKTEPAFGLILGLKEPFSALLALEDSSDEDLILLMEPMYRG